MKLKSTQLDVETLHRLVEQALKIEISAPHQPRKNMLERLRLSLKRLKLLIQHGLRNPRALLRHIPGIRAINRGIRRLLRLNWMEERISQLQHELHQLRKDHELHKLRTDTARNAQFQTLNKQIEEISLRTIRLERPLNEALEKLGIVPMAHGEAHETWYHNLEQELRGVETIIQSRQKQYLPLIMHLKDSRDPIKALDIGCGRGEWVGLLRNLGITSVGIDTDPKMLSAAQELGLDVHLADLTDYLAQGSNNNWDVISAFHVVEHLFLPKLLNLFAEAWRLLSPGGLLILETPNPENIQVGAYSFWLDPTHVRPLPPPLLSNLAAHYGFVDIQILRANPWPQFQADGGTDLNKLLYCEQDYALVARRP